MVGTLVGPVLARGPLLRSLPRHVHLMRVAEMDPVTEPLLENERRMKAETSAEAKSPAVDPLSAIESAAKEVRWRFLHEKGGKACSFCYTCSRLRLTNDVLVGDCPSEEAPLAKGRSSRGPCFWHEPCADAGRAAAGEAGPAAAGTFRPPRRGRGLWPGPDHCPAASRAAGRGARVQAAGRDGARQVL